MFSMMCDFLHTDKEKQFIINKLRKTLKRLVKKDDTVYFFCSNQVHPLDTNAQIIAEIEEEGATFISQGRASQGHIMARLPDGVPIKGTNLIAKSDISILYAASNGDGGGQDGIEGMLMTDIAAGSGGFATPSLLNQKTTGAGVRQLGMITVCGILVLKGGLKANGLVFCGKEENIKRDSEQKTTVVIPKMEKDDDKTPPRPSGACWLRKGETQDAFIDRFMERNQKFRALSSLERLAYELGTLRDKELKGHEVEWEVIEEHKDYQKGSVERLAYEKWAKEGKQK